jgi:hypothetical protein
MNRMKFKGVNDKDISDRAGLFTENTRVIHKYLAENWQHDMKCARILSGK